MAERDAPTGVLLVNLGTPDSPGVRDVRRYLREFLSDPFVIDIPAPLRWLLLHAVILPFRPRRSAHAYRSIWTAAGSPLLVHGRALASALGAELGPAWRVALGMRYGRPSIAEALDSLCAAGVGRIAAIPLFPQYAASSSGSAIARVRAVAAERAPELPLAIAPEFYDAPGFIDAFAAVARPALAAFRPDHVLLSYHGLPERHVRREDPTGRHCLASPGCCDAIVAANARCYRAQSFATSRALAAALALPAGGWSVAFQSRLGRDRWIEPFTDRALPELAARGLRRLAVACPSFAADCLETLEEIGIRAREQWRALGGADFLLVPCPNADPAWVRALAGLAREAARLAPPGANP